MKKKLKNGASKYFGDPRYEKVWEQMKLLGIDDVSTRRQSDNGTITWRLPIKNKWNNGSFIEVASFKSGYVRNNNSGYSNYQLNKCKPRTEYFKDYKWNENFTKQTFTGKYNKFTCKERILIPIEIDRLEYLISYCLKNYYIKHANFVANGDYIPKWRLEHAVSANLSSNPGHRDRISVLETKEREYSNIIRDLEGDSDTRQVPFWAQVERAVKTTNLDQANVNTTCVPCARKGAIYGAV